jgi:hypothetical protein
VRDADILNRLTTVHWITIAELTKSLARYYQREVAVRDVRALLAHLDARRYITRRPRLEAGHRYGIDEFQLTAAGAVERVRVSATAYDPFARTLR